MPTKLAVFLTCATLALAEKKAIRPPAGPSSGPYSAGVMTEKLLYVSGHVGPEPGGGFAPFDIKTQTRRALDLVAKVVKEAGLDTRNIVSTTLYLTDIRTLDAADAAYREFFQEPYPARVEIESQLLIPEALVEVSAVAVRGDWRAIEPEGWAKPKRPASHAALAGGTLFFSSLRPVDPATGALAGNAIEQQVAQTVRNQQAALAAAGMKLAGMAATRIYLGDSSYSASLGEVHASARAIVSGTPFEPGHLVHMQSVAARGSSGTLYLPGITGRTADGKFARNDIKAQTRQALATIEETLKRHGMTFADAIDAVVWLRDPRHASAMNEVYREIVKPNPPARATVRLSPTDPDALIEIMMIAHKP
ncbi:MAG: RidA family protein [Bryobacteraceae bacterium]